MRIAIIGTFSAATTASGGPGRVANELAAALVTCCNIQFDLLGLSVPQAKIKRFIARNAQFASISGLPPVEIVTPRTLFHRAQGVYALVHFLGTLSFYTLPVIFWLHRRGIPTLATLNGLYRTERQLGYPYTSLDIWAETIGIHYVSHIVAVSKHFQELVEQVYPICRGKISTIEHGVPRFALASEAMAVQASDEILCVSGTRQVKGVPFLMDALANDWVNINQPHLILAGPPGSDHQRVMAQAKALGQHFTYLNQVSTDELAVLYQRCSVYVQPSLYESLGLVALEAMAFGKPVIVTRDCGIASLIEDGVNGFIVNYGDVVSLREKIELVLLDDALARRVGEQARLTAQQYTWERAANRYTEIYRQLVQ